MNNNNDYYFTSLQDQEQDEALEILADVFKVRAAQQEHHRMERQTSDSTTETNRCSLSSSSSHTISSSSSQGSLYEELVRFQRAHSIGVVDLSPRSIEHDLEQQQHHHYNPLPSLAPRRASYDGHVPTKSPVSLDGVPIQAPPRSTYRPPLSRDYLQKHYHGRDDVTTPTTRLPLLPSQPHLTVPLRRACTVPNVTTKSHHQRQESLREKQIEIFEKLKKEQEAKRIMERNDEAYARRLQLELNAMSLTQESSTVVLDRELEREQQCSEIITEENHDDEALKFVLELSVCEEEDKLNTLTTWEDMMFVNKPSCMDTSFSTADTLSLSWEHSPISSSPAYPWCMSPSFAHDEDKSNNHRNRFEPPTTTRPSSRRD